MSRLVRLLLKIGMLVFGVMSFACAQTTQIYTGVIKDLSGAVVTSGQVTFTLAPPTDSTIPGIGRFVPTTIPCNINIDGTLSGFVSGVVSGACTVTANISLSPSGTSYRICEQPNFAIPGSCFYDYALGGTKDISSIAPTLSTGPVNFGAPVGPQGPVGPAGPSGAFTQAGFLSAAAYLGSTGTFAAMMVDTSTQNSTITISGLTPLPNGTTTVSSDRNILALSGGKFTCPVGVCTLQFSGGDVNGPTDTTIFGTNVVPLGLKSVRPEWLGSTTLGPFVIGSLASAGGTVYLNSVAYQTGFSPNVTSFPTTCMSKDNVQIIGTSRPVYTGSFTALQQGTIIQGGLGVCANNFTVRHVGIDTGSAWVAAGHAADNGLVVDGPNWGAETITDPILIGPYLHDIIALGSAANAQFHAILVEHSSNFSLSDIQAAFDTHCLAVKSINGSVTNFFGQGCSDDGLIIKGDSYTSVSGVKASNITVQFVAPGDSGAGVLVQSGQNGNVSNVNVSNVNTVGLLAGLHLLNTSTSTSPQGLINNVQFNNVQILETLITGKVPACIVSDSGGSPPAGIINLAIQFTGIICTNSTGLVATGGTPNVATPINISIPLGQSSISHWLNFNADTAILQGTIAINGWEDFGATTTFPTFVATGSGTQIKVHDYYSNRSNPPAVPGSLIDIDGGNVISSTLDGTGIIARQAVTSPPGAGTPFTVYNNGTASCDFAVQNSTRTANTMTMCNGELGVPGFINTPILQLVPAGSSCNSTLAGTFNYIAGSTGVKDIVQVCAKDASNTYAFRPIY